MVDDLHGAAAAAADAPGAASRDGRDGCDDKKQPSLAAGDPSACDALAAAALENPAAPFAPGVINDLATLKRADPFKFETLRTRLKKAGCRVTELSGLIAKAGGERLDGRPPSQADVLVMLAEAAELFHTPDEIGYADIEINGHSETWGIKTRGFRRWLRRRYFEEQDSAPTGEAIATAIGVVDAKAQYDTPVREVFVRIGRLDDKIYLDLADAKWRAVEIDQAGWRVVDYVGGAHGGGALSEVRFRRTPDMQALPVPKAGGSVEELRPLFNIAAGDAGDDDFVLAIAYALACLRGRGPYPVMAIGGEQGSAKSTRSALLRSIIDPRRPPLRSLPRDERDLVVAARNQHILAFDNVSGLRHWLSDALCRVASGAGFGTRELYTDQDEVVFSGARPTILNGIEEVVERPDLAERSIFSTCEPIDPKDRKSEDDVWASFHAAHASILGALLDAVASGLRRFPTMARPQNLPRMADFAHWVIACEAALWPQDTFINAYSANILAAVESVLEASPVAVAVRKLVENLVSGKWEGTATRLLEDLTSLVSERTAHSESWPGSGRALSGRLRRAASFLRRVGVNIAFRRDPGGQARTIVITTQPLVELAETDTRPAEPVCAVEDNEVRKSSSRPSQPSQKKDRAGAHDDRPVRPEAAPDDDSDGNFGGAF